MSLLETVDSPALVEGGIAREWRSGGGSEADRSASGLREGLAVAVCTMSRPDSLGRFLRSLAEQVRQPDQLLVVDASADDASERVLREYVATSRAASEVSYFRVFGSSAGLTRQRNFALARTRMDLVAFFDDDVVLLPGCLSEMETTHRELGDAVAGVGARIDNEPAEMSRLWRLRRAVGIVSTLAPGRYFRSGMSTPWALADDSAARSDGDWLPGCAMMWKTALARRLGFHEGFAGYAQGEDLEFCLRARATGRLILTPAARVLHLHEASGRPDHVRLGYMAIYNRYAIHRRTIANRSWRDVAWFSYAWAVDTLLLFRHLFFIRRWSPTFAQVKGRVKAAADILRGR
jgi:GT2 family glycosyltransferase